MRGSDFAKTERSRELRSEQTDAERRLWHRLRARQINGHKFVRQKPIGPYIVDFICREWRLVVEVDGGQHAGNPRDAVRDRWLTDDGYRVLRFWNNDVLQNMAGVLEMIAGALPAEVPPHPTRSARRPLPAGGER